MLISCFFRGQRIVSVRSDWSDMFDEIICLDNAHAGHKKNPREMMVSLRELCFRRVPM